MVVLKSFFAPLLKGYSPCHLPLVIIKENTIIVSTFGTACLLCTTLQVPAAANCKAILACPENMDSLKKNVFFFPSPIIMKENMRQNVPNTS